MVLERQSVGPTRQAVIHDERASLLREVSLFQGLDTKALTLIARMAHRRRVERGAFFFLQGDAPLFLYLLTRGRVRLAQVTPEGYQVVFGFIGPRSVFGGIAVLGAAEYPVSAEAVEDCEALAWDGETMTRLMEEYPQLALNAIDLMARHVQELQDRLRELMTERVERRIARTLLRLVRQTGRKVEAGILIDIPLTRQDLAEMTGTTLYTVSRILSRWESQHLIKCGRAQVIIRKPHSLVVIAEDLPSDPPEERALAS